jgi:hypothetical protein
MVGEGLTFSRRGWHNHDERGRRAADQPGSGPVATGRAGSVTQFDQEPT